MENEAIKNYLILIVSCYQDRQNKNVNIIVIKIMTIMILMMIIIIVIIIAIIIMTIKVILIIVVEIIINTPFQPDNFSTGSTTVTTNPFLLK